VIAFRRPKSLLISPGRDPRPGDLVRVCVVTRAGHHYQTLAEGKPNSKQWAPGVLESSEHEASEPGDDSTPHRIPIDCAKERLLASASPAAPPTTPGVTTASVSPMTPSGVPDAQLWSPEKIARYDRNCPRSGGAGPGERRGSLHMRGTIGVSIGSRGEDEDGARHDAPIAQGPFRQTIWMPFTGLR
jgi:hypothetical protein